MDNILEFNERISIIKTKQDKCRKLWKEAMNCVKEKAQIECCLKINNWYECRTETKNELLNGCNDIFKKINS